METLLFTPSVDTRYGQDKISSRIGLNSSAISFDVQADLYEYTREKKQHNVKLQCVLVDEAQFLTKAQVYQLTEVVDKLDIPVLTYGLRSDFRAEPFEGSQYLLILADNLVEIKTICHCGRKAIMNMRVDEHGKAVKSGEQIQIGGNESYVAMCRKHFKA